MSLLIYSPKSNHRLEYILDFIFKEVLHCDYLLTNCILEYEQTEYAKISYSGNNTAGGIHIVPHNILQESNIQKQDIELFNWRDKQSFFKTSENEIPFDIFAASFYLVSRYEEYLSTTKDEFERFPHEHSLAFRNNFLNLPLIDLWLLEFKKVLLAHFPKLVFKNNKFKFTPTYDIDIAYSYKHKGLIRNTGGALKDISRGNFGAVKNRLAVLTGSAEDPFDSFDFLDELHEKFELSPIYFFLLGSGGKLDKNLSTDNIAFKNLIKRIVKKYQVGIHPSYRSNDEIEELNKEVQRLNSIGSIQAIRSRQHYIRFTLPRTYQAIIEHSIKEDYSMGYGSINGFRASTSNSFYWFDLDKNESTDLKVFPFCFMECNSFFEQKQNTEETEKEIAHYIHQVKKVNGTLISIWHNFSLGTDPIWKGWKELYLKMIKQASSQES